MEKTYVDGFNYNFFRFVLFCCFQFVYFEIHFFNVWNLKS